MFGLKERFTRKVYFEIVPRRTKLILMKIIEDRVLPESYIMSDSWRAYLDIDTSANKYTHKMINHSVHFVDPNDRNVHTQGVESIWRAAKQKFKAMNGVDRRYLKSYLIEFTWR